MDDIDFSCDFFGDAPPPVPDVSAPARIDKPGLYELPASAYHADPCPEPALSYSIAKVLLDESAAHAYDLHPRLGGRRREPTATFDHGSLVHALVLGAGSKIEVVHAKDWRTKDARLAREGARAVGHIPVLADAYSEAKVAAEHITANLAKAGVAFTGRSEVAVAWQEEVSTGTPWCRGMVDHLILEPTRAFIYDLKTCRSAHPKTCAKQVIDYGYELQAHAYTRAIEVLHPRLAGRVHFMLCFVETEPPYAVTVGLRDGLMRERGQRRWDDALNRWAFNLRHNHWPAYSTAPVVLESPTWLLQAEDAA